jgi:hypothetical protein
VVPPCDVVVVAAVVVVVALVVVVVGAVVVVVALVVVVVAAVVVVVALVVVVVGAVVVVVALVVVVVALVVVVVALVVVVVAAAVVGGAVVGGGGGGGGGGTVTNTVVVVLGTVVVLVITVVVAGSVVVVGEAVGVTATVVRGGAPGLRRLCVPCLGWVAVGVGWVAVGVGWGCVVSGLVVVDAIVARGASPPGLLAVFPLGLVVEVALDPRPSAVFLFEVRCVAVAFPLVKERAAETCPRPRRRPPRAVRPGPRRRLDRSPLWPRREPCPFASAIPTDLPPRPEARPPGLAPVVVVVDPGGSDVDVDGAAWPFMARRACCSRRAGGLGCLGAGSAVVFGRNVVGGSVVGGTVLVGSILATRDDADGKGTLVPRANARVTKSLVRASIVRVVLTCWRPMSSKKLLASLSNWPKWALACTPSVSPSRGSRPARSWCPAWPLILELFIPKTISDAMVCAAAALFAASKGWLLDPAEIPTDQAPPVSADGT